MKKLIRPSCSVCKALAKAIDAYIAKVDNDLEDEMSDAGYVDAKDSVKAASALEEEVREILTEQTEEIAEVVENAGSIPKAKKKVSEYFEDDVTGTILSQTFADYFSDTVQSLANSYMKETEGDLVVSQLRARTSSWIEEWSGQLSDLMQLTSENQMGTLLQDALDNGEGCMTLAQRLLNEGIRNEGYRARATAVTEMLRAHSVAQQESIMQSPATDRKKWVHSGAHKNKPRENHVVMSGQIVPKAEPFELTGRDGGTYYPLYPRDPILPAAESINCHCIHIPVTNDDILGLSYEERQRMQQEIIAADDGEWEKELSEKLRNQTGVSDDIADEVERAISHSNTSAADRWAKSHLGVEKTNYTKQDIKTVNRVNRALQRLYKEYPELNGAIDEIQFTKNMSLSDVAVANVKTGNGKKRITLKLNTTYFENSKTIDNLIKEQVACGQWTSKRGLYGILKHEVTHVRSYLKSFQEYDSVSEAMQAIKSEEICKEVKKKALDACNITDDDAIIEKELSLLATKNSEEFVAEGISSSKSTKLTKAIKTAFDERMEE